MQEVGKKHIQRVALKAVYMLFYMHVRFMEALQIYPITKLCYKLQDHVLGIEIGRGDFGGKLVLQDIKTRSPFVFPPFACLGINTQ